MNGLHKALVDALTPLAMAAKLRQQTLTAQGEAVLAQHWEKLYQRAAAALLANGAPTP